MSGPSRAVRGRPNPGICQEPTPCQCFQEFQSNVEHQVRVVVIHCCSYPHIQNTQNILCLLLKIKFFMRDSDFKEFF